MKLAPSQRGNTRRTHQSGMSMIELLVAFVIFSFGMLGLAGLQTKTLSYSQASLVRSQASALTDDAFDRLRADRLRAMAGQWNSGLDVPSSSSTIVVADLADWKRQVEGLLPNGQGSISVSSGTGEVTIIIRWSDGREDGVQFETVSRI